MVLEIDWGLGLKVQGLLEILNWVTISGSLYIGEVVDILYIEVVVGQGAKLSYYNVEIYRVIWFPQNWLKATFHDIQWVAF